MNIFQKGLIGLHRLVEPEFDKFYKEEILNFNKAVDSSLTNAWDNSPHVQIDLGSYGIGNAPAQDPKDRNKIAKREEILSYDHIYDFYKLNSLIRSCVDTKVKQIVSLDWFIQPKKFHYLQMDNLPNKVERERDYLHGLLYNPNGYDESFQSLITKVLTDLLLYDAGVMKKIYSKETGKPIGLIALHAPEIRYIINKYKEPVGFYNSRTKDTYSEEDIIYLKYHGNTNSLYGLPPIESIIPEITGDIASILHNNKFFSDNEIPPGLLYLGDVDQFNYDRVKASFRAYKAKHYAIRLLAGKTEPKWINFKHTNRDMQFSELQTSIRKRVMAVYQINDNELGYTSEVQQKGGESQRDIFEKKGIKPLVRLLEYHLNTEFIQNINPDFEFCFDRKTDLKKEEEFKQIVCQTDLMKVQLYNLMYIEGKISLNEYRKLAGSLISIKEVMELKQLPWGDVNIVGSGHQSLENSLRLAQKEIIDTNKNNMVDGMGDSSSKNVSPKDFEAYIENMMANNTPEMNPKLQQLLAGSTPSIVKPQTAPKEEIKSTNAENKEAPIPKKTNLPNPVAFHTMPDNMKKAKVKKG